jgi:hypothetical protein
MTLVTVVGRNSNFQDLTKEEYDELGGVEYRSLSVLFWIVLTVSSRHILALELGSFFWQFKVLPGHTIPGFHSHRAVYACKVQIRL